VVDGCGDPARSLGRGGVEGVDVGIGCRHVLKDLLEQALSDRGVSLWFGQAALGSLCS
jgi:hypothetical protein